MAIGLPDYSRAIRPTYGGALLLPAVKTVSINSRTTMISVAGKGMIYGGYFALVYTSTQKNSIPEVWCDGNSISDLRFVDLNTLGLSKQGVYTTVLTKYDDVNFEYCAAISYGITFEKTLTIIYFEKHGTTPNVACAICFALV